MIYALHGAVGEASDWTALSHKFKSEGFALARVDLWQYLACCPMPLQDFGAAFNREVKASSPVILGYSMGGRLALHALLNQPQKWDKAVIVSAHTGLEDKAVKGQRAGRDAMWAAQALNGMWDDFIREWNAQGVLDGGDMPQRASLKHRREQVARSFIDWSVSQQDDLLPELAKITCPVLWIVGSKDQKFVDVARLAAAQQPLIRLCVIEGVGHRVPWEAPEAFAREVLEFITEA
ncbi:alpha/beta fold hydrolase [Rubritalea marina]|uniref:alpha/beta fold hydrolase n=1 Tax=Rubritalea marina TaxID=361055 RepID=UPI0003784E95|nr:alpha/beta fold hydrolase [Rubritalea marina]